MKGFIKNVQVKKSFLFQKRFSKYIILLVSIFFDFLKYTTKKEVSSNSHYIFTFWEPHNSLPGYLKLCMKTWKKYLPPDYKIIMLDYANLRNYLGSKLVNQILCKDMNLQLQADAIRVAILHKYGGFWMDADTIIMNSECLNMFKGSDLIMFGNSKKKKQHIGFIYALKNSTIIKAWLDDIISKVKIYKQRLSLKRLFSTEYYIHSYNKLRQWSYLGNGILDNLVKNVSENTFKRIEKNIVYLLPEEIFLKGSFNKRYNDFYFSSMDSMPFLEKCKGILCLHNSWTPKKYKKMSEEEFQRQDIMLARLLSILLSEDNLYSNTSNLINYY